MRVLVFGTSNSLLRNGWVSGLGDYAPDLIIDNWSVGMSPSTRFSAYADKDFSEYDFVFFDAVPNDEVLEQDMGEEILKAEILKTIFSWISLQTRLVVLGFCWKQKIYDKSLSFKRHQILSDQTGGQFIDIASIVSDFGKKHGLEVDDIYENHDAHPHSLIAFEIGRSIASVICGINLDEWRIPDQKHFRTSPFKVIDIEDKKFSHLEKEFLSNSMMSGTFANIKTGQLIQFDEGSCIGLYINLGNTDGVIELGRHINKTRIQLFKGQNPWPYFTKLFVPIANIVCDSIAVCSNCSDVDIINRYSGKGTPREAVVAISKICFFDREVAITLPDLPPSRYLGPASLNEQVTTFFFSSAMKYRLQVVADKINRANCEAPDYQKLLDLCKIIESDESQNVELLMGCFDFGIRKYGAVKDAFGHHLFTKEKYRSLLKLKAWDKADHFVSNLAPSVTADGWPRVLKARALAHAGKVDESMAEWQAVLQVRPQDDEAQKALGLGK